MIWHGHGRSGLTHLLLHHDVTATSAYFLEPIAGESGIESIRDIDDALSLPKIARRQVSAVKLGHGLRGPGLDKALEPFVRPRAFLDFETVRLAVPVWNGCSP